MVESRGGWQPSPENLNNATTVMNAVASSGKSELYYNAGEIEHV